ncbi:MAG: N-acetylmuramoyl-L-alanine amidase, partial [bacterium]|nr:N-acetylmuramoyl-L-alanine amidase [bacterium]
MDFFKKISTVLILSTSVLVLTVFGLINLENSYKTKSLTIESPEIITMDSRRVSYQDILIAPYKSKDSFMSEEKSPGFEFTSVGGSWDEISVEGTKVDAEVKFKVDDVWTDWIEMEEELDELSGKSYAMASSDPATSMKYRFILLGDGKNSPVVKNIDWTYIKAGKKVQLTAIEEPRYSSFIALAKDPGGVIPRSQWGADESYRYLSDNSMDYPLVELDPEFYEKYADELQYSRVVETDENGDKYKWPLQYPEKVKKVIVHHTATTKNLEDPAQAIRDIYHYHAITRAWGDIGYNYIVDLDGNVYEGRAGGEGVIGAHSGSGNHGSIGIAVLGNYQDSEIPETVITKMSQFIFKKSKIHGIDTDGKSLFRDELMYNIF